MGGGDGGSKNSGGIGGILLHKFVGNEVTDLFNGNFNSLFNHNQIGNDLLFFSVT